ncbi:hypothetical protein K9N68_10870 [Kovacikia minuta CCNUW1]|uniref:hypothetical protein n=1 Tax=Kovacikia minuta TaxID=2931930 RepID=UPI001CCC074C|nr:hypothetical protein [Kovacikia minuta]UBF28331.1 hypothetical protein K9N68_10870 [Kovacikia minuta CCNUW1]
MSGLEFPMDALINRIVLLCKGDKEKAKTYIRGAMAYYPGQTALWYLQKVISDLEQQQVEQFRQRKIAPSTVSTPGKALRQLLAQSRSDNPGKSEAWHLKNAQQQAKSQPSNLVDPKQMGQLLERLRGDRSAANRLIENMRSRYPGKSDKWVLDKVMYDLERDRR